MTATLSIQHTCRVESYVAAAATYMPAGLVLLSQTPTVQTCLLVECCCKMDACWTVATHLACLLTFCMRGSRIFFRGGPGPMARKQSGQRFVFVVLVVNLFYSLQRGSHGLITEKTIPFHGSRGSPIFPRVVQLFPGGPIANLYRNPYNL